MDRQKNTIAPKAASVIHTDFEKNFIRAEAVSCEDFIKYGSAEKCKENGKLRIEGKDYIIKMVMFYISESILDQIFSCLDKQELSKELSILLL